MAIIGPVASVKAVSRNAMLWAVVGIAAAVHVATGLFHDIGGTVAIHAALLVAPPFLFALMHGSVIYGFRNMVVFVIICLVVTNVMENINILTGYPGGYHFTESLNPTLFSVPLVIGPAYFGTGYLAWMLAHLILSQADRPWSRRAALEVPVISAFLMVAWNFSFDPLASTVRQAWIWREGGSYFGVPVTNFFSWYLTSYLFFQLYALYLLRVENPRQKIAEREYWLQPVVLYGTTAAIAILAAVTLRTTETVMDAAGVAWRIRDIYAVCALSVLFVLLSSRPSGLDGLT
jgi:uncharacterized membrane protein